MSAPLSAPLLAPRVRFAPSPTGFFHVGGARTALFNWLIARSSGGTFVLRVEDTDTERNRDEWTTGIIEAMKWLGIEADEGPYFQSQRSELYNDAIATLLASGEAYYCDCNSDATKARNIANFGALGEGKGYDGFCRTRELGSGAVRFKAPDEGQTVVHDLVRGEPTFENALIEDFVIARTNGTTMFLLANVVDDLEMGITHVLRAEEHLPNTPKAIMLAKALTRGSDTALPIFAHLPVIVNEKRQKLSKRRDKVAVEDYRALGILPHAMRNYLATLGWTPPGDVEIIDLETMIDTFDLAHVHKSPAFFDFAKLSAFNGHYIRSLDESEFLSAARPYLDGPLNPINGPLPSVLGTGAQTTSVDGSVLRGSFTPQSYKPALFEAVIGGVQERVKLLSAAPTFVDYLFGSPLIDPDALTKVAALDFAVPLLKGFIDQCPMGAGFATQPLMDLVGELAVANGTKPGKAQGPIRLAITGTTSGLPLFESMVLLGRDECLSRLNALCSQLCASPRE